MANDFNFASVPFENERLPRLVFGTVAAIVLGATLVHGFYLARYLVREQEELDIKVSELRSLLEQTNVEMQRLDGSLSQQQSALATERTGFLTRIYRHKSFSWTGLFNELETITPAGIRIVSITPNETDGQIEVTLSVVGRTLANVLEMVRALEASSFFGTVFPVDEVDLQELGGSDTGTAATLRLQYIEPIHREPSTAPISPAETPEPGESVTDETSATTEADGETGVAPPTQDMP